MRLKLSLSKLGIVAFALAAGTLIGYQIAHPVKRVLEAIGGLILAYLIWNFSAVSALWLILIIYPFPFALWAGNSTFIFVVIVVIIYLIRVSAHTATLRFDRQFNLPIALMVLSYALSFYNFQGDPEAIRFGIIHTINFLACIFLFYLLINLVNDERKLRTAINISMITCALVMLFSILELLFPGRQLIPGWLYTEHKAQLVMKGIRTGGPFKDFELNAEFFAMNAPIILFMAARSRRLLTRLLYTFLLVADIAMLFTTVTRGAFISLTIGLTYMAYVSRRDLSFIRLIMIGGALVGLAFVIDTIVAQYTISGSLFGRLVATTFEKGILPENRVDSWGDALARGLEHPFIGHGPGWNFSTAVGRQFWPHNAYLFYFNITGLVGLATFIFLLVRLFKASLAGYHRSLLRSPFSEGFMKVLHVLLIMFIIDQIKIEFLRNNIYMYFVWIVFGLIAATRNIIRDEVRSRTGTGPA
jgi:O-antigen ligase